MNRPTGSKIRWARNIVVKLAFRYQTGKLDHKLKGRYERATAILLAKRLSED